MIYQYSNLFYDICKITRSLIIFELNKIDVRYCFLSNVWALLSKSETVFIYLTFYVQMNKFNFENGFQKVKPKYWIINNN